jgi:hypothetical protein
MGFTAGMQAGSNVKHHLGLRLPLSCLGSAVFLGSPQKGNQQW